MKVVIEFTEEMILNLFISASEGGSNYWCQEYTPKGRSGGDAYQAMLKGFVLIDGETGKKHDVKVANIKKACQLMGTKEYVRHLADVLSDNTDADTGDVFLQLCVFGEVIYG